MAEPLPPETPEAEPRNPFGWIVLGLLLLLSFVNLAASFKPSKTGNTGTPLRTELKAALAMREASRRLHAPSKGLEDFAAELALRRKKDPEAAAYWVAAQTELGKPVAPSDLAPALEGKDESLRRVAQAYAEPATNVGERAARLDKAGVLGRLAATHLRQKAGFPHARDWVRSLGDRYLAILGVAAASFAAWVALALASSAGAVPRLGPPITARSHGEADRFALRAAALFASFAAVGLLVGFLPLDLPKGAKTILSGAAMFAIVPLVLRARPSFDEAVGSKGFLGRKVLLGLWAFLLEIPVTLIAASVGSLVFRSLPQAEHPAATALMEGQSLLGVVAVFFSGAVVAPFWEETMFRGLLFPALRRLLNGTTAAALLSSLVFASIHPQGPGGWIGLMAFAVCSCVLAMRTRSLVPSMVMHAAHNGTLLALAILMGG